MSGTERTVAWRKDDPFGVEFAEVRFATNGLRATGVGVGTDPAPYRLDYELETGDGFVTTRLHVTARGEGWHRALDLRRSPSGDWNVDTGIEGEGRSMAPAGGEVEPLKGALDCDLGLSPLTNSMPVLREPFSRAGRQDKRQETSSAGSAGGC